MKYEKEPLKTNLRLEKTPKKSYNTEGNNDYQKFKPYYPNAIFNQFSSKRKTQYNPFNIKIPFSVDKKNANFPLLKKGKQQFLSKQKKEWSNIDFSNSGNIYEKLNLKNPYERDNLLIQIYHTQKDINQANREIRDLKKMQEIIEKENLANKFMIGQLLNKNKQIKIESSENTIQSIDKEEKNQTEQIDNASNKREESINKSKSKSIQKGKDKNMESKSVSFNIKNNKSSVKTKSKTNTNTIKKEKNKYLDSDKLKINILKKGLNYYKYHLNKKEEELAEFKGKEEVKQYTQINDLIEKKNKSLEELIKKNNEIRSKINKTDEQILNISAKIYNMKENSIKINSKILNYKKNIEEIENKIKYLEEEKLKLEKNEKKLEEQKKEEEEEKEKEKEKVTKKEKKESKETKETKEKDTKLLGKKTRRPKTRRRTRNKSLKRGRNRIGRRI